MTARNLQQPELESYWSALAASAPSLQTLDGIGTGAQLGLEGTTVSMSFAQVQRGPQVEAPAQTIKARPPQLS